MAKQKITISIKGHFGSGKTRLLNIIKEALEIKGYKSTSLHEFENMPERRLVWNDFHDIHLHTELPKESEVSHG